MSISYCKLGKNHNGYLDVVFINDKEQKFSRELLLAGEYKSLSTNPIYHKIEHLKAVEAMMQYQRVDTVRTEV